ncbi:MAG TPA: glycosyltransferase family 2 protein, partial [Tepidisphaeraceae bacterium]|nr:glycosyltransferase family 2 protein [Tepidisphaeraceae bacterium]
MNWIETAISFGFWCSVFGVVYAYLCYPIVIYICSRLFGKTPIAPTIVEDKPPRVTLLIAAYNEEAVIEERIQNALKLNYPRDYLDIVIASDGSDDATAEICRRYANQVRLFDYRERRGKSATLNATMAQLDTDIVVFSDANTSMDADAIRHLTRWFADPKVGAVCGRLVLTDPETGNNVDSVYWRYETFLKRCEARLDGLLGANGAIYAIRRDLFVPLPAGTLVDDFVAPLLAKMRSKCRIVYDVEARAFEESAPDLHGEYRRRARIGTGGFQAIGILWPLLGPSYGWTAFTFWSHKILRWACPCFMIGALLFSALLVNHNLYRGLLVAQCVFYALCVLGSVGTTNRAMKLLRVFTMFA